MVDPDDDNKSIVRRLRGSQRKLAVVLVLLLVGSATIAVAQQQETLIEDFEDGNMNEWDANYDLSGAVTDDNPIIGQYSFYHSASFRDSAYTELPETTPGSVSAYIRVPEGEMSSDDDADHRGVGIWDGSVSNYEFWGVGAFVDDGDILAANNEDIGEYVDTGIDIEAGTTYRIILHNIDWEANTYDVRVEDLSGTSLGEYEGANIEDINHEEEHSDFTITVDDGGFYVDNIYTGTVPGYEVSGGVTDENGNNISNATITATNSTGAEVSSAETTSLGSYTMSLTNGAYNLTASKDGYFPQTETVTVGGEDVTQDFQLRNHSAELSIDAPLFLEHGQSSPYSVVYESQNGTDARLTRERVTDDATVTSNDTGVVTVNQADQEIVATDDTSVNNRTYIEAEYTTDGETYTAQRNVTVANATVENLDILPPVTRFSASISDTNIQVIIIAAAAGAAASLIATSFAGVSAMAMIMMLGWIAGFVGDGMAMVTVFIALFVGLNLAAQIDYTVRR